jgi:hypothetical protein
MANITNNKTTKLDTTLSENTMLIDMHAHSSGISPCCLLPYDKIIETSLATGINGIVLTNHYQKSYAKDGNYLAFAKRYTSEYKLAKAYGEKVGFKVFFGVEITMEKYGGTHLLVYGITESFIEENPTLFDLTLQELYTLVKKVGGIVVQAHPYRRVKNLLDVKYLDGVEVNCHPLYLNSYFEDMLKIATDNNLLLTCGGDYHADTPRSHCGMYLPDTVTDGISLGEYIKNTNRVELLIQDYGSIYYRFFNAVAHQICKTFLQENGCVLNNDGVFYITFFC